MQDTMNRVTEMLGSNLPGLLAALAVLVVGWLAAFALSALTRSLMKRTQLDDRLAIWLGDDTTAPHDTFERWIPRAVYYLVLLLVLVAFLQTLGLTVVTEPLNRLLNQIFEFAPRIGGAIILLVAAWLIATILKAAVTRILKLSNFEERLGSAATLDKERRVSIARTLGEAVYWLIFLLFLPAILDTLVLEGLLSPVQQMMDENTAPFASVYATQPPIENRIGALRDKSGGAD